jgi:DNA-directed RNA polymerase subunit E'/Rpb7
MSNKTKKMKDYDDIYYDLNIQKNILLKPKYFNKNLELNILEQIKSEIEGKCIREGFVKSNSTEILKRERGKQIIGDFTGLILFKTFVKVKIANPKINKIIIAKVLNKNKLGILAKNGPLEIIIPRELHDKNEKKQLDELEIHSEILLKIIGVKYDINDTKISVVAKLQQDKVDKVVKTIKVRKVKKQQLSKQNNNLLEDDKLKDIDIEELGEEEEEKVEEEEDTLSEESDFEELEEDLVEKEESENETEIENDLELVEDMPLATEDYNQSPEGEYEEESEEETEGETGGETEGESEFE